MGDTPIDLALWNEEVPEEIFRFLWNKDLILEEIDDDLGTTRLHRIVERGFIRSLQEIILKEKNSAGSYFEYIQNGELGFQSRIRKADRIWVRDEDGDTLFHTAARKGNLEILQMLYLYDPKFYEAHNEEGISGIELMNLELKAKFTNWLIFQG
jgi:ankyrin repeat protein